MSPNNSRSCSAGRETVGTVYRKAEMMKVKVSMLAAWLFLATGCGSESKNYTCLDDAAHDKIGVLMGSAQDGFITGKYPGAEIVRIDMSTDLISALAAGSCDVAVLSAIEAREILKVNRNLKIVQDDVYATPLGVGFNKNNTALRDAFNAFLSEIKRDGLHKQIVGRWTRDGAAAAMPEIALPDTGVPLTIGTTSVSVPFSYEKDGTLSGIDIEIITRFAASVGRPVRFLKMNFGGLIPALVSNKVDVIINCIMITPERAKEIAFSDVYFEDKSAAVAMSKNVTDAAVLPNP